MKQVEKFEIIESYTANPFVRLRYCLLPKFSQVEQLEDRYLLMSSFCIRKNGHIVQISMKLVKAIIETPDLPDLPAGHA